jgi:voltage-gated potassium channel
LAVRSSRDTSFVLREEIQSLRGWQDHHHRLVARLLLILISTLIVDAVGTFIIYFAERHARGTDIHTLGDALFFSTVQLLTVSSQIRNPFTIVGRTVDVVLEIWAVLVVAGSAGAFTAFLQDAQQPS